MKKWILLIAVIVMSTAGLAQAQEGKLGIDVDITWVSKYIWRGIDVLDDKAAFQPSVAIDLGSGFSAKLWASYAGSSKGNGSISTVDSTELDYILAYGTKLFEGESYATNFSAQYVYYDFIDQPTKGSSRAGRIRADAQEIGVGFAWPNICPAGIVPSYYVGRIWQTRSNSTLANNYGGWAHVFGLGYDLTVENLLPNTPEQVISLSMAAVYNDGYVGADNDWSHIVLGASTSLDCGPGTFTPAVYFQKSMEDTVNTEDEFWTSLSYKISF